MKTLTELQFWKQAKREFSNPLSMYIGLGVGLCYFVDRCELSLTTLDRIHKKIENEIAHRGKKCYHDPSMYFMVDYLASPNRVSPIRLRFINRMIRQLQAKKVKK